MKIKDIWKEFKETTTNALKDCWFQIRKAWKSTWDVFKIALIDFVKAVFVWIWSILSGIGLIVLDTLKIIFAALTAAVKATLGILCDKVISWIKKA